MRFPKIFLTVGTVVAIAATTFGCSSAKNDEALQQYVGAWQFTSVSRGEEGEQPAPGGGVQLEASKGRLIGIAPGGVLELEPSGDGQVAGTLWVFGLGAEAIQVPVTAEFSEEGGKQMSIMVKASEVDTSSLPAQFQEQFSQDITFKAQSVDLPSSDELADRLGGAEASAAKNSLGSINRAQQAYALENDGFASTIEDLKVGIEEETEQYSYSLKPLGENGVQSLATPKAAELKSYTGGVFKSGDTTVTILCESEQPSQEAPPPPELDGEKPSCPSGFAPVQ